MGVPVRRPSGRSAAVVVCVLLLMAGADYATYAATGDSLVIGRGNAAGSPTTLRNTGPGPALALVTRSSRAAPLRVNGRGLVRNLNADLVDGLDSSQLQRRVSGRCADGEAARAVTGGGALECVPVGASPTVLVADPGPYEGPTAFALPALTAGTYRIDLQAGFAVAGSVGDPFVVGCALYDEPTGTTYARDGGADVGYGYYPGVSAAAVLEVTADSVLRVSCHARRSAGSGPWSFTDPDSLRVTATPVPEPTVDDLPVAP